jgi:hypothetical protein
MAALAPLRMDRWTPTLRSAASTRLRGWSAILTAVGLNIGSRTRPAEPGALAKCPNSNSAQSDPPPTDIVLRLRGT